MSKLKVGESQGQDHLRTSGEIGSPYAILGCGPRIKRLTTWEPERWQKPKDPVGAGLPLLTRESMRFHNWENRQSQSLSFAHYVAKDLARGNLSLSNILVLAGPTGVGKTHLAIAIAWEWFEDEFNVLFTRVDDLLDYLRRGYDDNSYHQRLEFVRQRDLLILDDLGTEHAQDWAGEKIDRIVDWRYIGRMPLVVTTNAKSEDLAPRVASRLSDKSCSTVIQIDAEDYRTTRSREGINEADSVPNR
ncbi:MAG: ATP-binding protein [Dehalococcoidales bacterium]|nr:ATP-binding protein [Dehalococcoidales bacterium]